MSLSAHADERAEPIHIEYTAPATCPSGAEFLGFVIAHTTRWTLAGATEPGRTFLATIDPGQAKFVGTLRVAALGPEASERKVESEDCVEVARALAVIAAVAIDPRASIVAELPPSSAPPPKAITPARAPLPRAPIPPPPAAPLARPRTIEQPPSRWQTRLAAEAGVGITTALVGGAMTGFRASIVGGLRSRSSSSRWLDPEVRLGFRQSLAYTASQPSGSAEFAWTAGSLELCPVRLPLPRRVELRPCLDADTGELWSRGVLVPNPEVRGRLWMDAGLSLGVRWFATNHLYLSVQAGPVVPLLREPFELAPQGAGTPVVVADPPVVGVDGDLRVAWQF